MNKPENIARSKIIRVFFELTIADFIISLGVVIVASLLGYISSNYVNYVLFRAVFPFIVNLGASFVALYVNKSLRYGNYEKCNVCSIAFTVITGSISFWNGYYSVLWCLPVLAIMFCSIFHDTHILFTVTVLSIILVGLSAFCQIMFTPDMYSYLMESMLVVMVVLLCAAIVSRTVILYNKEMQNNLYDVKEKNEGYRQRLETDQLTYLHTRPYAQEKADLFLLSASPEHPVSLAVVDLDFFKSINDTYGHKNGDVVLWKFGDTVNKNMIDNLVVGRYGGEEFIFVFDGGNAQDHRDYMNKLREKFGAIRYKFTDRSVTFSCGIVTTTFPVTFSEAFKYADAGVYASKDNGRNQVTAYLMPTPDQQ